MFAHTILANQLLAAGMTKAEAHEEMNALFAWFGHFPKSEQTLLRLDALKDIALNR